MISQEFCQEYPIAHWALIPFEKMPKNQIFIFAKMTAIWPNFNILSLRFFANIRILIVLSDSTIRILGHKSSCEVTSKK